MSNFGPLRLAVAILSLLVLAVLAVPQTASADPVLYTFQNTSTAFALSFSFEVPAIITGTGTTTIITSLLSESDTGTFWTSNSCGPILQVTILDPSSLAPLILVDASCEVAFGFNLQPIDKFGTFEAPYQNGEIILTISQTPEPTTALLFGSGLLLFGMIGGRKRLHAAELSAR